MFGSRPSTKVLKFNVEHVSKSLTTHFRIKPFTRIFNVNRSPNEKLVSKLDLKSFFRSGTLILLLFRWLNVSDAKYTTREMKINRGSLYELRSWIDNSPNGCNFATFFEFYFKLNQARPIWDMDRELYSR